MPGTSPGTVAHGTGHPRAADRLALNHAILELARGEKEPAERRNHRQEKTEKNTLRWRDRDQQEKACCAGSRMQQGERPGRQLRARHVRSRNQTAHGCNRKGLAVSS
jgi:hypothetical protein